MKLLQCKKISRIPDAFRQQQNPQQIIVDTTKKLTANATINVKPTVFKIFPIWSPIGWSSEVAKDSSCSSVSRWDKSITAIDLYTRECAALFKKPFNVWSDPSVDSSGVLALTDDKTHDKTMIEDKNSHEQQRAIVNVTLYLKNKSICNFSNFNMQQRSNPYLISLRNPSLLLFPSVHRENKHYLANGVDCLLTINLITNITLSLCRV